MVGCRVSVRNKWLMVMRMMMTGSRESSGKSGHLVAAIMMLLAAQILVKGFYFVTIWCVQ